MSENEPHLISRTVIMGDTFDELWQLWTGKISMTVQCYRINGKYVGRTTYDRHLAAAVKRDEVRQLKGVPP